MEGPCNAASQAVFDVIVRTIIFGRFSSNYSGVYFAQSNQIKIYSTTSLLDVL